MLGQQVSSDNACITSVAALEWDIGRPLELGLRKLRQERGADWATRKDGLATPLITFGEQNFWQRGYKHIDWKQSSLENDCVCLKPLVELPPGQKLVLDIGGMPSFKRYRAWNPAAKVGLPGDRVDPAGLPPELAASACGSKFETSCWVRSFTQGDFHRLTRFGNVKLRLDGREKVPQEPERDPLGALKVNDAVPKNQPRSFVEGWETEKQVLGLHW
eukprot:TRINITY_DN61407_c0_g1_i1.p1 TRINITY_DN61407_c0_g1~~TRINITY_DN61407_c0_g1_i1.p1  ORF type:complete len:217 (+),score=33.72 TRINITY_DN61407_c0_g1_i1:431-1081(+)